MDISIKNNEYLIVGNLPEVLRDEIPSLVDEGEGIYTCPLLPYSSFALACYTLANQDKVQITDEAKDYLKALAKESPFPTATIKEAGQIHIKIPVLPAYANLMQQLGARGRRLNIYSVPQSRLYEFNRIITTWKHDFLPTLKYEDVLKEHINRDLTISPDMTSLFKADIKDLHSVEYGWQMKVDNAKKKLKWNSVGDIILSRPRRYEDRTASQSYKSAPFGVPITFKVKFISVMPSFNYKITLYKVKDFYSNKEVTCQQYGNISFILKDMKPDTVMYLIGIKIGKNRISVNSILKESDVESLPIAPVYSASPNSGFSSRVITNITNEILIRFKGQDLLDYVKTKRTFWDCIQSLHFPKNIKDYEDAIDTLAFYELVALQLIFMNKRNEGIKPIGVHKERIYNGYFDTAISVLPFDLTEGQKKGIKTAIDKMKDDRPSNMLLSGDVGSGKSIVATLLAMFVVDNNQQVVIVGPTEILARQLYNTVKHLCKLMDNAPKVEFISASVKSTEQKQIKKRADEGLTDIIVGTHSALSMNYHNLGLIIIDEEQKFGAKQRELLQKSRTDGRKPDILSQTATPIPRTTALAFYGDSDLIQLKEKPSGRKDIITEWVKTIPSNAISETDSVIWQRMSSEIDKGNQVFVICPAVEENDDSDFISVKEAQKTMDKIKKNIARSIHGKTSKKEQEETMNAFKNKEFPILIGSSVLEVGINVPDATVMVILDADRFGASSLHQIRGRVGRSDKQSYCFLVSSKTSSVVERRLQSLVDSNNGFDIALTDLETRKEGDILGIRQSGESALRFSNFVDHSKLIELAQIEAERLFKSSIKQQALLDATALLTPSRI